MRMWCYETLTMQKPKFSWEMLFFESGDTEVFKADRSSLQVILHCRGVFKNIFPCSCCSLLIFVAKKGTKGPELQF